MLMLDFDLYGGYWFNPKGTDKENGRPWHMGTLQLVSLYGISQA